METYLSFAPLVMLRSVSNLSVTIFNHEFACLQALRIISRRRTVASSLNKKGRELETALAVVECRSCPIEYVEEFVH